MSEIVSKNLYELLGNNHDEDSDKEPEPPVKVIDKTPARTTKRNAPAEAPASKVHVPTEGRGGRRGGYQGNEAAYRDRNAGSANNRVKSTDDGVRNDRFSRRGAYEGRVGAAGSTRTRGAREQDRHSRGVGGDSEKQANHGWGATEGTAELADENAGEEIAKAEQKEALTADGGPALADGSAEPEAEPEDNSISYEEYLAQLAEKKLALGSGPLEARKANEGSKQDKQWASAKPLAKDDEEDFVSGSGGKAKRERERKQKQVVDIDQAWNETAARGPSDRGGRGAFRGPRGDGPRGGFRGDRGGDRGRGGFRGDRGGSRGGDRGGRGRGGDARAPRGNSAGGAINTADQSAFPSLGGN